MPTVRPLVLQSIELLEARRLMALTPTAFPLTSGGPGFDNAQRTAIDADGNLFVTGLFSGTVDFDPGARNRSLAARGDTDIYLAKYTEIGSFLWATQIGGTYTDDSLEDYEDREILINPTRMGAFIGKVGEQPQEAGEYVQDLKVDAAGNAHVVGSFRGLIRIGGQRLVADETFDDDFHDALVVKFDPEGAPAWTKQVGGPFHDTALTLGLDRVGNAYVGGYFTRQADFGNGVVTTEGRDSGFVMRLSTGGEIGWVYRFESDEAGSADRNAVNDLVVTPSGNVYFAGTFAGDANFDLRGAGYELEAEGKTDAYLAYINRKGRFGWALATGGDESDGNSAIAADAAGNIYTAGYFAGEVDVNPRPDVTTLLQAQSDNNRDERTDLLISRFAADGRPIWQAQMGGEDYEVIADLQVDDSDGSIYTLGSFYGEADFAPGKGIAVLNSAESNDGSIRDRNSRSRRDETYDWFLSRLSPRGKHVSVSRIGGADDDFASGLTISGPRQILLAGRTVAARGERDERHEQSLVQLLNL